VESFALFLHVRPTTCKWVYKVKTRSNSSLDRYKASLVVRDFQQEHGHDYETFSLVTHRTIVHTLLVIASIQKWSISQLDIKNDFLNSLPCNHRLVILFLGVWFVTFMAWFGKA
jgi:hypothetical protein